MKNTEMSALAALLREVADELDEASSPQPGMIAALPAAPSPNPSTRADGLSCLVTYAERWERQNGRVLDTNALRDASAEIVPRCGQRGPWAERYLAGVAYLGGTEAFKAATPGERYAARHVRMH